MDCLIQTQQFNQNNQQNNSQTINEQNFSQTLFSTQNNPTKIETEKILISKSKAKKIGKLKRKKHNKPSLSMLTEVELNETNNFSQINNEQIELSNSLDEKDENNEIKKFFTTTNLIN